MSDADLQRDLRALRDDYLHRLPARLAEIEALLHGAHTRDEREGLESACRLAHMLKGTSGSYGLDAISAELSRIEAQLDRQLRAVTPDLGASREALERAMRLVRDRVGATARPGREPT